MTLVSITPNWQEAVDTVMSEARHRDWTEGLGAIRATSKLDDALGMYRSFKGELLLNAAYDGSHPRRILLHELGHHLHYRRVLGPPDNFDKKEDWITWHEYMFHSYDANEYVAWQFAHFHDDGEFHEDWNESMYHRLDGPPLDEPLAETLKFE